MAATLNLPQAQPVTGADLYADAGKPCCLCRLPLDPADADRTGLAHAGCALIEMANVKADWRDYDMTVPADPFPTEGQVVADAYRAEIDF